MKSIKEKYPHAVEEISKDIQDIIDLAQDCINQSDVQDLRFLYAVAISLKQRFKELTN